MALFRKKEKILDLTEYYNKRKPEIAGTSSETIDLTSDSENNSTNSNQNENTGGFFGSFFGSANTTTKNESPTIIESSEDNPLAIQEKKRRLAKRLKNMTDKLEDMSNQIYHLQQRIELLEKKAEIR